MHPWMWSPNQEGGEEMLFFQGAVIQLDCLGASGELEGAQGWS